MHLPNKIYNKFNQIPIYTPIIEDIKYMIDNCVVDSFDNKILYKDNKTPRKYSVLLKYLKVMDLIIVFIYVIIMNLVN